MQYVLNDRRTYITTIEFRNTSPILNIERLRLFQEEGLVGNFTKKEFRYSFDNVSWQPWQTLTNSNLMSIGFQDQNNFFIHIKYTRTNVIAGNVNAIYLTYDSKRITPPSPLDSSIIDADYLQGENGEYYLNRENQIGPLANKMKTIQGMISQYFIMKNNNIHIDFISATNKLKDFIKDTTNKTDYKERKKLGIQITTQLIKSEDRFNKWSSFLDKHNKKDDLSDCFLQGLWYIKNKL